MLSDKEILDFLELDLDKEIQLAGGGFQMTLVIESDSPTESIREALSRMILGDGVEHIKVVDGEVRES